MAGAVVLAAINSLAAAAAEPGSPAPPSAAASPGAAGEAWSLAQLMPALAAVDRLEAVFVERKDLAMLAEPLVSTGFLRYRAPDFLQKQVLQPAPEDYRIEGDRVIVERAGADRQELAIDRYPALAAFVASIRATLAGDLPTLERFYQVRLDGDAGGWTLQLVPRDPEMGRRVSGILIRGQRSQVESLEMLEAGGDRSLMTIRPVSE
jgi:hypothetical protein